MIYEYGDPVIIVPDEAKGDITHHLCQEGLVVRNTKDFVYIRKKINGHLLTQEIAVRHSNVVPKRRRMHQDF